MNDIRQYLFESPFFKKAFLFLVFAIPFFLASIKVWSAEVSFWYDNARDLLSAWNNLSNPTLIGPTSGIPGIFYGPYWIWMLSLPLIFSKDPRFVSFVVGVIPYFIIFPVILFQFRKMFSYATISIIWIVFSTGFGLTYAHNLWNPRIAPVLVLFLILLLQKFSTEKILQPKKFLLLTLSGFISGIIINVHISFGIGIFLGSILFLLLELCIFDKKQIISKLIVLAQTLSAFLIGTAFTFLPFVVFEIRHHFSQITTAFHALTKFGNVVAIHGLSQSEILLEFLKSLRMLLHLPLTPQWTLPIIILSCGIVSYYVFRVRNNKDEEATEKKKLLLLLACLSITILTLYLTAKNPIWDYHFISFEIIFLLFISILIEKISWLKVLGLVWCTVVLVQTSFLFIAESQRPSFSVSNLRTKIYITDTIAQDAKSTPYTVFSYQSAIYQYEYSYLFRWRYNKDVAYDPGQIPMDYSLVYIVLPAANSKNHDVLSDFQSYRTPEKQYKTDKTWTIPDGSTILKRVKR